MSPFIPGMIFLSHNFGWLLKWNRQMVWAEIYLKKKEYFSSESEATIFISGLYKAPIWRNMRCVLACKSKIVVSILFQKTWVDKKHLKYLKENSEGKGDGNNITFNHSQHQNTGYTEENAKEKGEQHKTNISVKRILIEVI